MVSGILSCAESNEPDWDQESCDQTEHIHQYSFQSALLGFGNLGLFGLYLYVDLLHGVPS
jgi:hypothetical protein